MSSLRSGRHALTLCGERPQRDLAADRVRSDRTGRTGRPLGALRFSFDVDLGDPASRPLGEIRRPALLEDRERLDALLARTHKVTVRGE